MIRSFRHKGLRRLFEEADARGVPPELVKKLRNILTFLNAANAPAEAAPFPGWRLHALKGDLSGFWSISVSGNWRVIFRFADGDAHDIDLVDYH
jgi:proteic killer suppression protein